MKLLKDKVFRSVEVIRAESALDLDSMKTTLMVDGKIKVFDLFRMNREKWDLYVIWKGQIYMIY